MEQEEEPPRDSKAKVENEQRYNNTSRWSSCSPMIGPCSIMKIVMLVLIVSIAVRVGVKFSPQFVHEVEEGTVTVKTSYVKCVLPEGYGELDRRCVYHNLILLNGIAYFIYDGNASAVNITNIRTCVDDTNLDYYQTWRPQMISLEEARSWKVSKSTFKSALIWHRLNPRNYYHHMFEDFVPILRLRLWAFDTQFDEKSDCQIIFVDKHKHEPDKFIDTYKWMFKKLPKHIMFWRRHAVQIPEVAVGSQTTCTHRIHCKYRFEPGILIQFRHAVFKYLLLDPPERAGAPPHVGIVQRLEKSKKCAHGSRSFTNIEGIVSSFGNCGTKPHLLEHITPRKQVELFSHFDVTVMMHGAAIGNMLFLKPGSVLFDIHPPRYLHPLAEWINEDLTALNITHVSIYLTDTDTSWTPFLVERIVNTYPDKEKGFVRRHIQNTSQCPPVSPDLCAAELFTCGSFAVNMTMLRAVYHLAWHDAILLPPDRKSLKFDFDDKFHPISINTSLNMNTLC